MTTAKFTPGPWEMDTETRPAEVCTIHGLPPQGEDGQKWVYVRGALGDWDATEETNLANAQLIAAAPELLRLLAQAYYRAADIRNEWPGRNSLTGQKILCDMRDTIAKAMGIDGQDVQDGNVMAAGAAA